MNTINNINKNGRLFAATVVTLIASLLPSTQVLAGRCEGWYDMRNFKGAYMGLWTKNSSSAAHLYEIRKNDGTDVGHRGDLGFVTSLYVRDATVYIRATRQWNDCGDKNYSFYNQKLEWKILDGTTEKYAQSYGMNNHRQWDEDCDNGDVHYSCSHDYFSYNSGDPSINIYDKVGPGDNYSLQMHFEMKGHCSDDNVNEYPYYCKYSTNEDFYVTFKKPGFIVSDHDFSTKKYGSAAETYTYNFNSYGWAKAYVSITNSDGSITFSDGTTAEKEITINNNNGSVELKFNYNYSGGTHTAKLHFRGNIYSTDFTDDADLSGTITTQPIVLEGAKPSVTGSTVKLSGFLKAYDCVADLYETGFEYWKTSTPGTVYTVKTTHTQAKTTNATWEETIYGLEAGNYSYKPYIKKTSATTATYKSALDYTFTVGACDYAVGDTIYYTIDGSANKDVCNLVFNTIAEAKTHLLSQTAWVSSSSSEPNKLLKHIVFQVAPGIYQTASGIAGAIDITEINKWDASNVYTPDKQFIIRALDPNDKDNRPTLYGVDMRYSRNITLNNLDIQRNTSEGEYDHSAVIAGNNVSNTRVAGFMSNANITIKNCYITGTAFCVLHITDCDGLYMENNNLKASIPSYSGDDEKLCDAVYWGSSIKMMNVKNAKILRNNFRGSHTTSLLIQGSQNLLIMNNVFWNENIIFDNSRKHISFIRLLAMAKTEDGGKNNKLTDIGIYYNTFYLKKNPSEDTQGYSTYKCDFFRLGGIDAQCDKASQRDNKDYYILKDNNTAKIEFMYNNCYSLSYVVTGTGAFGAAPFLDKPATDPIGIKNNNFWSVYDSPSATSSVFAIGSNNDFINVSQLLCKTVPDDPDGLVMKGSDLNKGVIVSTTTGTGVGAGKIRTDRNGLQNARPTSGTGWTYGAYQQSVSTGEIDVIYWNGKEGSNWDTRGSWYKKVNGDYKALTCVDILSNNLKAIIMDNASTYPVIQEWKNYPNLENGEEVRTGITGSDATGYVGSKFVKDIDIEYGAALAGVENLKPGTNRYYNSATVRFEVLPKTWTLVGSVIAHESKTTPGEPDDITSYDFYKQHQPEIYMQHVVVNDKNELKWGVPFADLDKVVSPTSCFAVYVADEYTDSKYYKYPASSFFRMPEHYDLDKAKNAASESAKYENSGFFINESGLPSLTVKGTGDECGGWNFFNNSYPACLKLSSLGTALGSGYNVHYYDMEDGWQSKAATSLVSSTDVVKPQNGFVIQKTGTGDATVNMEVSWFDNSKGTKYKSALAQGIFTLRAVNILESKGARVTVQADGDNVDALIGVNPEYPVIYIPSENNRLSSFSINSESAIVPLTVLNQGTSQFHLQFMTYELIGFESIVLEDRLTGLSYNLSGGEQPTIYGIPTGLTEGRFFLNINNYSEGGDDEEPEVPTTVEDVKDECLIIFNRGRELTVSSKYKEVIETIYISDMAGRTLNFTPTSAYYSVNVLPLASGVYTVTVVTEKRTAQQKILIK